MNHDIRGVCEEFHCFWLECTICEKEKKARVNNLYRSQLVNAALNYLPKEREGRQALDYENYIRTGRGLPSNRIYRESSADRTARKESAAIRNKDRLQQQVKLVRLMKKLLIEVDHKRSFEEVDDELESMRTKVAQLEMKVEKAARRQDISCEDMFDMKKPGDAYDDKLEQIVRTVTLNMSNEKIDRTDQGIGDHVNILTSSTNSSQSPDEDGDQTLAQRTREKQSIDNELFCFK